MNRKKPKDRSVTRRKKLFSIFATNLSSLDSSYKDIFRCPICLKDFQISEIAKLSLAHLWPRKLGGQYVTLTCHNCNQFCGRTQDVNLVKAENERRLLSKIVYSEDELGEEAIVPMEIGGQALRPRVTMGKGRVDIQLDTGCHHPRAKQEAIEYLKRNPFRISINIPLSEDIDRWAANVALLTLAYLTTFSYFGYFYILKPSLLKIRTQIGNPFQSFLPNVFIWNAIDEETHNTSLKPRVGVACADDLVCLFVHINDWLVFLPSGDDVKLRVYDILKIASENEKPTLPFREYVILSFEESKKIRPASLSAIIDRGRKVVIF